MPPSFSRVVFNRWQAINESDLPGELKDTLRGLLFYLRDRDECYPGTSRLARDLSIDPRAIRKRLRRLEELGLIRREAGQNQRRIRVLWSTLERDDSPPKPELQDRPCEAKPGTPGPGGRNSRTGGAELQDRQTRNSSSPKENREENTEESIEENWGRKGHSPESSSGKFDPLKVEFPASLGTAGIREAWQDWTATRRESRKPLTRTSARLAIGKLERAGPAAALEALQESAANGWQGLFPEKYINNGKGNNGKGLQGAVFRRGQPEPTF